MPKAKTSDERTDDRGPGPDDQEVLVTHMAPVDDDQAAAEEDE